MFDEKVDHRERERVESGVSDMCIIERGVCVCVCVCGCVRVGIACHTMSVTIAQCRG